MSEPVAFKGAAVFDGETLQDGAVRLVADAGETPKRALARATSVPAAVIGAPDGMGSLQQPLDRLIYLGPDKAPSACCDTL